MNIQQEDLDKKINNVYHRCPGQADKTSSQLLSILSYYDVPGVGGGLYFTLHSNRSFICRYTNKERLNTKLCSFPVAFAAVRISSRIWRGILGPLSR